MTLASCDVLRSQQPDAPNKVKTLRRLPDPDNTGDPERKKSRISSASMSQDFDATTMSQDFDATATMSQDFDATMSQDFGATTMSQHSDSQGRPVDVYGNILWTDSLEAEFNPTIVIPEDSQEAETVPNT